MLKRHEVEILLKAGHPKTEVARLSGVSLRSVKRIAQEKPVVEVDDKAEPTRGRKNVRIPPTTTKKATDLCLLPIDSIRESPLASKRGHEEWCGHPRPDYLPKTRKGYHDSRGEYKAKAVRYHVRVMDEGRKRVLGIMAAILAARKLCQLESTRPSPALHSIIADAIVFVERIMQRIDAQWPAR